MKNDWDNIFLKLFNLNINCLDKKFNFEEKFEKKLHKLDVKNLYNTLNKVLEILQSKNIDHYKNLRKPLQKYKRVHVNSSYVILFYDEKKKKIIFVDYEHHDKIYKKR